MEGTCDYSQICGRDALDGRDGRCILHSEDPDKDKDLFREALGEHREKHNEDFRQMVFPTEIEFEEGETIIGWT